MTKILAHFNQRCTLIRQAALKSILISTLALLAACSRIDIVQRPSANQNSRVSIIVIHYTAINFEESVAALTQPSSRPVSSHYLIPEPNDPSYTGDALEIYQLVPEDRRAWHAGVSYWSGRWALNDQSIGIELVNQAYCHAYAAENASQDEETLQENLCFFPDFAESQIKALIKLLRHIHTRNPDIDPTHIVGHSDIAPERKIDPGPRFPWQRLYQLGYGAWFDNETAIKYWERFRKMPMPLINIQKALKTYGYKIEPTGILDKQTKFVLRAFQMHFRPSHVTSTPTPETTAILYALIEKYRHNALAELLEIVPEESGKTLQADP